MRNKIQSFIKTSIISLVLSMTSVSTSYAGIDVKALQSRFNEISQQQINQNKNPKYADRNDLDINVDPITGNLKLSETDLSFPGKDGLDLNIGRIYNSSQNECDFEVAFYEKEVDYTAYYFDVVMFSNGSIIGVTPLGPWDTYAEAYAYYSSYSAYQNPYTTCSSVYYGTRKVTVMAPKNFTDKYNYNKTRYYLGAGWSFAFPSVQIEDGGTKLYYHDGAGNCYKITGTSDNGTSNLDGYQGNNVQFLADNESYTNEDKIKSSYKFINSDKTTSYFASDGRLLGIRDRFGNQIKFKHVSKTIYEKTFPLISQITDSVGRIVRFSYEGNDINLTITAPNETNQLHFSYKRNFYTKEISSNGNIIEQYKFPILYCVTDSDGGSTLYHDYHDNNSYPTARYSYTDKILSNAVNDCRYLLGDIEYMASKTVFNYDKITRNLGTQGLTDDYRVNSRSDYIRKYNSSTITNEWVGGDINKVYYTYTGDCTGYPGGMVNDQLPAGYQFSSTCTYNNGLSVKNIFNQDMQLIQQETTASNKEKEIIGYIEFDSKYKYLPVKIKTTKYASDGSPSQTYFTGTTYNDWGGISSSTAPLTQQQYDNANTKALYTTYFSYENSTYKYFMTKKQWYQSSSVQLNEVYSYNLDGRIASYKNAKGEIVNYNYYDLNGNKIQEVTQTLENNKTAKTRQVFGSETGYAYPKEIISCYTGSNGANLESKTSRTYNMLFGVVKSETDNENKTTTYTYDNLGRVTCIQQPNFISTSNQSILPRQEYKYFEGYWTGYSDGIYTGIYGTMVNSATIYHDITNNIDRYYNENSTFYDGYGNIRDQRLWDFDKQAYITEAKYTYDNLLRVTSSTDAEGNIVTQTYGAWGQVKECFDASGNMYVSDYDIKNNKTMSFFVAKDNIASYRANTNSNAYKEDYIETQLDQFNRITERRVYENWPTVSGTLSEQYEYDIAGNLTGYIDPKRNLNEDGKTTTYQYDVLNRIISVKDAMNKVTNVNYSVLSNILSVDMKQNASSTSSINLYSKKYDELGHMTGKTDPTSLTTSYNYNTLGFKTKVVDRNGSTLSLSYDALGLIQVTNQISADNTRSIQHKYNNDQPFGTTKELVYINGKLDSLNDFNYNAFGNITLKNCSGNGLISYILRCSYNSTGNLISTGTEPIEGNYFYTNYKYAKDRLTQVQTNGQNANSISDTDNVTYDYYPDGKLKKVTYPKLIDNTFLTTEYAYNPLGRMTSMINKKGSSVLSQFTYSYDANGNITTVNDGQTTKTYVYDKLNRISEIQTPVGNCIVYTYDLRGNRQTEINNNNILDMVNTNYTYDLENKLQTVTKGTAITTMKYNSDGYRAKKETSSGYTNYVYNLSGKVIAEAKNSTTITSNYVWGPDRVLVKKESGGSVYYYLYNGHGDVVQMVDRNGKIVNNYKYDEWGNILGSNETVSNPFKYAGEIYDQETGLYYLRARYYDPTVGRFLNEDTVEGQIDNPLSLNLYSYCYNNPLIYSDPSGHSVIATLLAKAGANGAADLMTQLALNYYFNPKTQGDIKASIGEINWWQVGRSALEGLIPWKTPGGVFGKAAATAVGDVVVNTINKGSVYSVNQAVQDFAVGFISDLSGSGINKLISKYGVDVVASGMKKMGFDNDMISKLTGVKVIPSVIGSAFDPNGSKVQMGVDPNTLKPCKILDSLDAQRQKNAVKYGMDKPIIVDRNGNVLDGHHRLKDAIENGRAVDIQIGY